MINFLSFLKKKQQKINAPHPSVEFCQ